MPLLAVNLPLAPAQATLPGSTFEAHDGNLKVDTSGNKDWNASPPSFTFGTDTPTGKNDTSFAGGVDEDTVNPAVRTGAIPNSKDDLNRFYAAYENIGSGNAAKAMLYLAWIRNKTSGSADMDFELNQSETVAANGLPVRSPGDLLITYEFIATKTPTIAVQRWITSGSGCVAAAAPPCWANRVSLASPNYEAKVNDGFTVFDTTPANPTPSKALASQTFGEAAINLTNIGIFSPSACMRFAKVFAKTRSSHSFSSSLQDYIAPRPINLTNCLTKTFSVQAAGGVPTGTTLYGVFFTPDGAKHSVPLSGSGTLTGSDGTVPPGATITNVHLELRNAAGTVLWSTPGQTETLSQDRTNSGTFGYTIDLTPDAAENHTGKAHDLQAKVLAAGTLNGVTYEPSAVVGLPVSFELVNRTPAGCGSLSASTSNTDAQGIATTVLTSSTACTTSIRAYVDKAGSTAGFNTGDVNDTASKQFAAYAVSVTPASATNVLGAVHTFTVKVTRDAGSGPVGLANEIVKLSLSDPSNAGASITQIVTDASDANGAKCRTGADGTCTVKATAQRTGTFTLKAVFDKVNDSGLGSFDATGTKTYVDYRVRVTPASAQNEVGDPHTFVATLEKSVDNAWTPAAGEVLALTLGKGTSDAAITSVDAAGPNASSCTTRADGTCAVTINASTPGLVTLTATYSTTLDSGQLTRSASGTKQYFSYSLTVTHQGPSLNAIGDAHTFLVTLKRFDGSNTANAGYAGQVVNLALANAGGATATITSIVAPGPTANSCTTGTDGTCRVTINSPTAGTSTLTASFQEVLSSTSTASLTASAVKRYLALTLGKAACATNVPVGGRITFDIPWSVQGATLTNAKITDNLPAGLTYVSATPTPSSHPAEGSSGPVVWNLNTVTPPAGDTIRITVAVAEGSWANPVTFTADEGVSKTVTAGSVTASNAGASASGRAYGLNVRLAGDDIVPPTPDVTTNSAEVPTGGIPLGVAPVISGGANLLKVSNSPTVGGSEARDEAQATAANVDVTVAGIRVRATAVQARSVSTANGGTAGTTTAGSVIKGLTISGGLAAPGAPPLPTNATVTEPGVYSVVNLLGEVVQIHVLESVSPSGAAAGVAQPQRSSTTDPRLFSSGEGVNGLRVNVLTGTAEVVVSHAESKAVFPAFDQCGTGAPFVLGRAAILDKSTVINGDVTDVVLGEVRLNSTGGDVSRSYNRTELAALGLDARTAYSETQGRLPRDADPGISASSAAGVEALSLPGLTASAVKATAASSDGSTTGSAHLAKVVIGTTDVCATLTLSSTCAPAANTKITTIPGLLVVLNEQEVNGTTITVNAIHIYALAANGMALPVGSDIVISTAMAGTS